MTESVSTYYILVTSGTYTLINPSPLLNELASTRLATHWQFKYHTAHTKECLVHVYHLAAQDIFPADTEEINRKAKQAIESQRRIH